MRKPWVLAVLVVAVCTLGGAVAPVRATPAAPYGVELAADGDPFAPDGTDTVFGVASSTTVTAWPCGRYPAAASVPVRARLGEAVALSDRLYTVRSVGVARHGAGRVWVVADVKFSAGCRQLVEEWDFVFVDLAGTVHRPSPQGREGEFSVFDVPAGGWVQGRVYFDLAMGEVAGGSVGFRRVSPAPTGFSVEPYGLWAVPDQLTAVPGPASYPLLCGTSEPADSYCR